MTAYLQAIRGPVLLILLGLLLYLSVTHVLAFNRSWPLLLVGFGIMKLAEKLFSSPAVPPPPQTGLGGL